MSRHAGRHRLAWTLALLGAGTLGWGAARWAAPATPPLPNAELAEAGQRMETEVRRCLRLLDRALDDAGRRLAESDAAEEHEAPGTAAAQRVEAAHYLAQVAPPATASDDPAGLALSFYDGAAGATRLLGRWVGGATQLLDEVPGPERLRATAIEALVRASPLTGWVLPSPRWVWFERGADSASVRIVRADVLHEFAIETDEQGRDPDLIEGAYLLCASLPLELPGGADVRCDIVGGELEPVAPPWARGAGAADGSFDAYEGLLAAPGWHVYPSPAESPRLAVRGPRKPVSSGSTTWMGFALGGALLLGLGIVLARRRPASVPVEVPDVTAEAAHEMRTPLTAMRGALEVALRRERNAKEYQDTLHQCLDEVKGLQNLHDAVLFLGRGARVEPASEQVDLLALVEGEVARVRGAHGERVLALDATPGPFPVVGDPSLLARLLGNLLDNAALHSTPGGAIRVALARVGSRVELTVEDDGPGVPEARRERIFERFYRGPEASRRGVPGSGLGLPIARWLAEIHGGTLRLDATPTDRARFRLVLPTAAA